MSELREKIAQAIAPDLWDKPTLLDVTSTRNFMRARADRILAVIEVEHRIVPREPTEGMIEAAKNIVRTWARLGDGFSPVERLYAEIYLAMTAAAPKVTK